MSAGKNSASAPCSMDEGVRFNNASVGREIRMIELKKEVNEFCAKLGEPAWYSLEFEKEGD